MGLALAANSGGINEPKFSAVATDDLIHGIARGSGNGRNDGALASGEPIQQRGLAHVGVTDDRNFNLSRWLLVVGRWRFLVRRGPIIYHGRRRLERACPGTGSLASR